MNTTTTIIHIDTYCQANRRLFHPFILQAYRVYRVCASTTKIKTRSAPIILLLRSLFYDNVNVNFLGNIFIYFFLNVVLIAWS